MAWADQIPAGLHRGLEPEDRDFVLAGRAKGYPDAAIARMIGKNVELVRALDTPPDLVALPRPVPMLPEPLPVMKAAAPAREWRLYVPRVVKMTIARIAEKHGLTADHLIGMSRQDHVVLARQEAMHELHQLGRFSLYAIGLYLGSRHHTTVLHGVRTHERMLATSSQRLGHAEGGILA